MGNNKSQNDKVENLAVCKKDQSGKVLSQNELCLKVCGHREGHTCIDHCMEKYKTENPGNSEGTFQFQNMEVEGTQYDILMVNDGDQILTLLLDLTNKHSSQTNFFKQFNLTPREEEILSCVIKKMKNKQIADQLCISEKTLKTHVNNILKKVPRQFWPRTV